MNDAIIFTPHPGPQTGFLASDADIAIYGGPSGCGGTWALIYAAARHATSRRVGLIFRRRRQDLIARGGLADRVLEFCQATGASVDKASRERARTSVRVDPARVGHGRARGPRRHRAPAACGRANTRRVRPMASSSSC